MSHLSLLPGTYKLVKKFMPHNGTYFCPTGTKITSIAPFKGRGDKWEPGMYMRIHLLKSKELSIEIFSQVIDVLTSIPGPYQFECEKDSVIDFEKDETYIKHVPDRVYFEKIENTLPRRPARYSRKFPIDLQAASWQTLFSKCNQYRADRLIPQEDMVILLTDISNPDNQFSAVDDDHTTNGYVHTDHWDHYIPCSPAFPIAYHVASLAVQRHIREAIGKNSTNLHPDPIGCINDHCKQKREVVLKLRTADICGECLDIIRPRLNDAYIQHILKILDTLRIRMLFAQNFRQDSALSRLVIDNKYQISLPDFGNITVRLRPLEKVLYLLFLKHPEGLFMNELHDYRLELQQSYEAIAPVALPDEVRKRIEDLTSPLSNSASEKISRIKRCFEESIGKDLASHYIIKGEVGDRKSISLNRMMVNGNLTN